MCIHICHLHLPQRAVHLLRPTRLRDRHQGLAGDTAARLLGSHRPWICVGPRNIWTHTLDIREDLCSAYKRNANNDDITDRSRSA